MKAIPTLLSIRVIALTSCLRVRCCHLGSPWLQGIPILEQYPLPSTLVQGDNLHRASPQCPCSPKQHIPYYLGGQGVLQGLPRNTISWWFPCLRQQIHGGRPASLDLFWSLPPQSVGRLAWSRTFPAWSFALGPSVTFLLLRNRRVPLYLRILFWPTWYGMMLDLNKVQIQKIICSRSKMHIMLTKHPCNLGHMTQIFGILKICHC